MDGKRHDKNRDILVLSVLNNNVNARQLERSLFATLVVLLTFMSTILEGFIRHAIFKMKGLSHPGLLILHFQWIRKLVALRLNQITILETSASKGQMTNSSEHSKVPHELLLRSLPMRSCSIASIVRITRRQEVPVNSQSCFSAVVISVAIIVANLILTQALLKISKIPTEMR